MSKSRSCDARCHKAKGATCVCWCGGLFHGAGGQASRDAFVEAFNEPPGHVEQFDSLTTSPGLFDTDPSAGDRWRAAVTAAVAARDAAMNTPRPAREYCQRCGRTVPARRRATGFCTARCALEQERADARERTHGARLPCRQ